MDQDQQDGNEQTLEQEMEAWSRAHPRATFAEMERAVEERIARLRVKWKLPAAYCDTSITATGRFLSKT